MAVLAATFLIALQDHHRHVGQERADAGAAVHAVGIRLQSMMNVRLALTGGLAAFAQVQENDLRQDRFERFAEQLAHTFDRQRGPGRVDGSVRSLQIAPDAVVTYVWPLAGNESAIGHDIANDPARGEAVRRSIEERSFVLAGPFELVQGGRGLIGRQPIFSSTSGEETFWGFATVVLNFDDLLALADIDDDHVGGYELAIRGRDGLGADGEVFFGSEELFDRNAVATSISLPQGTWQLVAVPEGGWTGFGERGSTRAILVTGAVLAAVLTLLLWRWLDALSRVERASEDLSILLSSIDGPVISTDDQLRVTHWNRTAAQVSGVPSGAAIGSDLGTVMSSFAPRRSGADITDVARLALADGTSRTFEAFVDTSDGSDQRAHRDFDFAIAVRGDGGVVLVGVETTARRAHDRIAADLAALEQTSKLKDDFLASTSHEMRTPLTSILGLAEMIADRDFGDLTAGQSKAVETIHRTGTHLLSVVNQVLDVASIASNGIELETAPVDLGEVVDSVVDIVEPLADAKGLSMSIEVECGACTIDGDAARLGEVVLNLLSNAVKFTPHGGSIGVSVTGRDDEVRLAVWDTGVGIPESQQHLLFQRFVRLENGTFSAGTGLGLSIAHEIVRLHDGEIDVESDPGHRTTFTVSLPHRHALTAV